MNLDQITTKCWILALIIRDDGERLLLGDGWFDFKDSLQHFQPNSIANDIVELQGTDGQLLAGQVRRSASQSFDGYVGDALTSKTEIENRRRQFIQFFRTRRHYKVIYIFPDGTAIQRRMGYLTDAPSVPEMWQKFPEYHVALNFEDVNYYEYAEDAQGDEIYAHDSLVKLISVQSGGLVWDENGAVSHGYTWLDPQTVTGDYITISDGTAGAPLSLTELDGNATQSGTPTPDAPVAINTVTGEQTVKVEGKNLFNVNVTPSSYTNTTASVSGNTITVTSTSGAYTARVDLPFVYEANKRMTISFDAKFIQNDAGDSLISQVCLRTPGTSDTIGNIILTKTVGQTNHYTATVSATASNNNTRQFWLYVKANSLAGAVKVEFSNIQIEYGDQASQYEPYQGQEFPIDLGSIELAKIGTYQDRIYKDDGKWYIEKQVGSVVFDGTENWQGYTTTGVQANFIGVSDIYVATSSSINFIGLSNYFTPTSQANLYNNDVDGISFRNSQSQLIIKKVDNTTVSAFKTWLGTHPTTVYYALATPTTTEITDETLLYQLNFLASLYGGVNNISLVGTGAQGEMTLNYYADVDTTGAGYEWEAGEGGGPTIVQVIGVDNAQPIWTVTGPATNPTLTNITTVQTITWNGTVPNGQKLVVDMANQTATLAGANVYEFITGSWLTLRPGANKLTYSAQGAEQASQIQWNGVVG